MPNSEKSAGRATMLVLLVAVNILLFGLWPWREKLTPLADSTDPPFITFPDGTHYLDLPSILRNRAPLAWFFGQVRAERKVLFFGTSESIHAYNIGSQLNSLRPEDPRLVITAQAGLSPIHLCLALSRAKERGIPFPPQMFIINLVYFTHSHDVINDGWLSLVTRTPEFMYMNHGNIQSHLTPGAQQAYYEHFADRAPLYPIWVQEYLGDLLFLCFHGMKPENVTYWGLPTPTYQFNGVIPTYDEARGVLAGYIAADQLAKERWIVSRTDTSVNLQGIASMLAILKQENAPVLLVILPTNRKFYAYNGIDMAEYDRRYANIRHRIAADAQADNLFLMDLYDLPLDRGFEDRMHPDAYGNFQLAKHIAASPTYERFLAAVRDYYRKQSNKD